MNKTAIVTGGSRGIGKEIVLTLLNNGIDVAYTYLNKSNEKEIRKNIHNDIKNIRLKSYYMDAKNNKSIKQTIEHIESDFNNICYLINNIGIIKDNYLMVMSNDNWNDVLNVNLNSVFYVTKEILPTLMLNKGSSIVNVSSVSGCVGSKGQCNYSASKAGLIALTKSLALEVAHNNIRVNAVVPGYVETDMTREIPKENLEKKIPLKRFGTPKEVANVVKFLLSSEASYVTGSVIQVDGGLIT